MALVGLFTAQVFINNLDLMFTIPKHFTVHKLHKLPQTGPSLYGLPSHDTLL